MNRFFPRLRKNLLSENRFSKYLLYAFGEIILVVIGILIALQINNWNEARKEQVKEKYYLNSIKTSIDLSQPELQRVIRDSRLISSCADTLFLMLSAGEFDQLEGITLDSLLFGAGDYSIISLNDGGIQEILNTGSLDIIKDEGIRVILASWHERMHKIRKFEAETGTNSKNYHQYLDQFVDSRRGELGRIVSVIIPDKRNELLTDPQLANYLAVIFFTHGKMHEMYAAEKSFLDSLDMLIDGYLAKLD